MSVNTKINGQLVPSAGLYTVTKPIGMADIYSTEEKEVGLWIDNRPLYQKTINLGTMPNNTSKTVAHGISNLDSIISFQGYYKNSNSGGIIPLSFTHRSALNEQLQLSADNTNITVITATDKTALTECYVTILYTKTTDTPWSGKFVPQGYGYVSSGDIYSLEERQVGVYTDGKPLYQKTLYIASLPSSKSTGTYSLNVSNAENCWVVDANSGTGNLDMVRVAEANANDMQSASVYARCGVVDGDVKVYVEVGRDRSSMSAYVTVRYTKTTDVAGSGEYVPSGDKAVHYSTEEQVIGTWIDGSTLYRKVIDFGVLPNATSKNVAHGISNLGRVCKCDCTAIDTSAGIGFTPPMPISLNNTTSNLIVTFDATNIKFNTGANLSNYNDCKVILEYTKTS